MPHQLRVSVLAPHTQWGDRLFFADSLHSWSGHELTTTSITFPWWSTEITLTKEGGEEFFCKCYIQRGQERIWESFKGNRYVFVKGELAVNFNKQYWVCVVCEELLTNPPVMCDESHAYHHDCFEPYPPPPPPPPPSF